MVKSRTFIATPPGATIKEQLIDRCLSQKEFAARMGMSEKHISKLINGDVQLTPDVAIRLEMVLGVPAKFWNDLESIYREKLIRANYENEMDADMSLAKKFPYSEMVKAGWIPDASRPQEKVIYLRKYFEVVQLGLLENPQITRIACRGLSETEKSDYALIAWAQKARIESRTVETSPIDLKTLTARIPDIRAMTKLPPEKFCPMLTQIMADSGIAMIFLPHIGGSFLHGAAFCEGHKIVVGLTVRGKYADKFWFSLFHELAHVLYGHIYQVNGTSEDDEAAADLYARDTLIPINKFNVFTEVGDFSKESIIRFATDMDIDAGIVVGRLQKEGWIPYSWHNELKSKYMFTYHQRPSR